MDSRVSRLGMVWLHVKLCGVGKIDFQGPRGNLQKQPVLLQNTWTVRVSGHPGSAGCEAHCTDGSSIDRGNSDINLKNSRSMPEIAVADFQSSCVLEHDQDE